MREPRQAMDTPLEQANYLLGHVELVGDDFDSAPVKTLLLDEIQAFALVSIAESLKRLVQDLRDERRNR